MAKSYYLPSLLLSVTFLITFISAIEAINGGFTVELIHRDSPRSPLSTTKTTPYQQVNNALRRSIQRANHFFPQANHLNDEAQSDVISIRGEYVMSYSIGTPPFQIFGIADTGSDLIWSQCAPCDNCYDQTAPKFDPKKSRTFQNIPCTSNQCSSVHSSVGQTSCAASNACQYNARYGDNSVSVGDIATETLTLGSTNGRHVAFPKTLFGCGFSNSGTFNEETSGIVGLGGGEVSLVSQISSSIEGKFSYCLVPLLSEKNSSKLNFGQNAVVSGSGTVSTPIATGGSTATFYRLTLEGMSVGDKRLEFLTGDSTSPGKAVAEGNIIIDSGTTLTLLPEDFSSKLEAEVASQIKLEPVNDPQSFLNLCYSSPVASDAIKVPIITAHFKGADVKLNSVNTFVRVSDDVVCFAFRGISQGSIFGNIAQVNYMVGYDLQKKTVSFKPTDCTKM